MTIVAELDDGFDALRQLLQRPCILKQEPVAPPAIYFSSMSRAAALRERDGVIESDHIVVLHDVSWRNYERILEIRGEHSAPRISYLEWWRPLHRP